MKYLELNNDFKINEIINENQTKCKSVFMQLQKLFDDNLSLVYLNNSFEDTLWYKKLLTKFKSLAAAKNYTCVDKIDKALKIYKLLFVKCLNLSLSAKKNHSNINNHLKHKIA